MLISKSTANKSDFGTKQMKIFNPIVITNIHYKNMYFKKCYLLLTQGFLHVSQILRKMTLMFPTSLFGPTIAMTVVKNPSE